MENDGLMEGATSWTKPGGEVSPIKPGNPSDEAKRNQNWDVYEDRWQALGNDSIW